MAEKVIFEYNEFMNGTKDKKHFLDIMNHTIPQIEKLYRAEGNLAISPAELKEWPENRQLCMDMTIRHYYYTMLEELKSKDKEIDGLHSGLNPIDKE